MTPEVIEVWIAEGGVDRRVGLLRPSFMRGRTLASSSSSSSSSFEYDEAWLRDGWAISPDLPLERSRIYTAESQTLPRAFSNTVPDDWGQKLIRADHARRRRQDDSLPPRLGEFDYLLGVADRTRVGAIRLAAGWLPGDVLVPAARLGTVARRLPAVTAVPLVFAETTSDVKPLRSLS